MRYYALLLAFVGAAHAADRPANFQAALKAWEGKAVSYVDDLGLHEATTLEFVGADYFCVTYAFKLAARQEPDSVSKCVPTARIRFISGKADRPFINAEERK